MADLTLKMVRVCILARENLHLLAQEPEILRFFSGPALCRTPVRLGLSVFIIGLVLTKWNLHLGARPGPPDPGAHLLEAQARIP